MTTKYHIFRIQQAAPPSESDSLCRETTSGQGASLAGKSHARKKIYTVLEKVTCRTAKGRHAPFFLAQEGKNSKKSPEKRAHLEKATLHHCDRGTPSCPRRGGRSKSTDPHRSTAHLDYSTEKSPFSVSGVTVSRTVSPCIVPETRNRLQSQRK